MSIGGEFLDISQRNHVVGSTTIKGITKIHGIYILIAQIQDYSHFKFQHIL